MSVTEQNIAQQIAQAYQTVRAEKRVKAKAKNKARANVPAGYKICSTCQRCLSIDKFGIDRRAKDGLNLKCKECSREASNLANHKNRATPEGRAYAREAVHKYRATEEGRATANEAAYAWARNNPERASANKQRYQAKKLRALPKWAKSAEETAEIDAFYLEAHVLTKLDGIQRHVDHIIPIRGVNVSGLHCADNLQILTKSENSSKGNRFSQDDAVAPNPFYYRRQK